MRSLRYLLEYLLALLILAAVRLMPLRIVTTLVNGLADLWYLLNISKRRIAKENIRRSGISSDTREISRIARESFRHLGLLVAESLKSRETLDRKNWRRHVDIDIPPETMTLLNDPGQGLILASGHLGNWEIAACLLSYIKPVVGITRKMSNPLTDRLMKKIKPRNRFRLTPKHDSNMGRFISVLRNGEVLALMMDQYAGQRGMMVEFLGRPASSHTAVALLHLVTRTPLCFGYCVRTGRMSFRLKALKPISHRPTGDKERDVRAILEKLNRELENAVRQNPEQYLWAHRRWRQPGIRLNKK